MRRPEPGLGEVDAGVIGRDEIARERAGLWNGRVLENSTATERAGKEVADDTLHVQSARAAEEVVIGEPTFELGEIDGVESGADAGFARRRLLHGDDDDLGRIGRSDVDGWARLDGGASKQVRFVECALAAQHLGSLEDVADVKSE